MCDSDGINAEKSAEKTPKDGKTRRRKPEEGLWGEGGEGLGSKDEVPGRRG